MTLAPDPGLAERLDAAGVTVERNVPVADLTTYSVGGPVAVLARVDSATELGALARVIADESPPLLLIGRGSNLLVADAGFDGLGVALGGEFDAIDLAAGPGLVRAGAAVPLPVLARRCAGVGRSGLEFFVGIPGSVGGAVRMNAGGHGRETADVLVDAEIVDLATASSAAGSVPERTTGSVPERRPVAGLGFTYRRSNLSATEVVTAATFRVGEGSVEAGEAAIADVVRWRREHQPGGSNAGSVFANPPGDSAGRLIDSLGLKGLRAGHAVVSEKHANFFQAEPGATADDVRALVVEVRRRVFVATGVTLVPELRMVGFDDADLALDHGSTS